MVVDDAAEAVRLVAAGHDVVLLVAADVPDRMDRATGLSGPGRLALYVTTGDPADRERAAAMDAELFGPRP